ncbi:MAG: D-aminoacyl-tRNA deacylase [Ignavibacteria bacterium]|jgi:D-tyrosyl-tRNA(Tyr) deacylase|nr:D-aminoacyl-tRNA deacylase [Ignavibacteria bacterium]
MKAVIQRVTTASVCIDGKVHASVGNGLLVLLGVSKNDTKINGDKIAKKIVDLRIFEDEKGLMNLSVKNTGGGILVISQFTICANTEKSGNRPSFSDAMEPVQANELFEYTVNRMKEYYLPENVKTGVFAAMMNVELVNSGPVTIIMEK